MTAVVVARSGTVGHFIVLGTALAGLSEPTLPHSDGSTLIWVLSNEAPGSSDAAPPQTGNFSARVHARIRILVEMSKAARHQVEEEVAIVGVLRHPRLDVVVTAVDAAASQRDVGVGELRRLRWRRGGSRSRRAEVTPAATVGLLPWRRAGRCRGERACEKQQEGGCR